MRRTFAYRRRATPLHACRPVVGAGYCLALIVAALLCRHPLVLAAVLAATLAAGGLAGAGPQLRRAAPLALWMALLTTGVNLLVSRQGLTVFVRLGDWGPLGQEDMTVEALVYGLVVSLRWATALFACVLFSAAVDPDELLRGARRLSPHSALTATLATRLVPVLFEDAARMDEARRCRGDAAATRRARLPLLRAVVGGSLDRALDVAAALEVRGYGSGARVRGERHPWSRHDLAFTASALALVAVAVGSRLASGAAFDAYPLLAARLGTDGVLIACALVVVALLPYADRRGIA